jgi:hypothetical protein
VLERGTEGASGRVERADCGRMASAPGMSALLGLNLLMSGFACGGAWYHVHVTFGLSYDKDISLWEDWWDNAGKVLAELGEEEVQQALDAARALSALAVALALGAFALSLIETIGICGMRRLVGLVSLLVALCATGAVAAWSAEMPWRDENPMLVYGYGFFFQALLSLSAFGAAMASCRRPRESALPVAQVYYVRLD